MDYDPEEKANQVLELTGDIPGGSRTLGVALVFVLVGAGLAIAAAELTGMAFEDDAKCELMARNLAHVLNGGALEVEGSTHVSCKAKQLEAS